METADSLKKIFGCHTDEELGAIFHRGSKAVSAWRTKGLPASIERRAYEIMEERGITPPGAAATATVDGLTQEMKEISEIFKNYPLIKATMLKMSAMTEDEQFEFYKMMRDAEIEKRKGGKAAAHVED